MNSRAYLLTILTYVLIASTLSVAYSYHQKGRAGDLGPIKSLEKISALKADVASDLSDIYGLEAALGNGKLVVNDSYRTGMQANLNAYRSYLGGSYATLLQSNISLGQAGFSFSLWPQNVTYEYADENKTAIRVYCRNSEITGYNVGINVLNGATADKTQASTSAGAFPFVLVVRNLVGAPVLSADALLDLASCSSYYANFTNGAAVNVSFGACSGLTRALIVARSGAQLGTDMDVAVIASNNTRLMANGVLTVSATGNITSSERVLMGGI